MAGSFYDGCYNPKRPTPGQLLSYCKKISANTQHLLIDVLHLHFYSTKKTKTIDRKVDRRLRLLILYIKLKHQIFSWCFSCY